MSIKVAHEAPGSSISALAAADSRSSRPGSLRLRRSTWRSVFAVRRSDRADVHGVAVPVYSCWSRRSAARRRTRGSTRCAARPRGCSAGCAASARPARGIALQRADLPLDAGDPAAGGARRGLALAVVSFHAVRARARAAVAFRSRARRRPHRSPRSASRCRRTPAGRRRAPGSSRPPSPEGVRRLPLELTALVSATMPSNARPSDDAVVWAVRHCRVARSNSPAFPVTGPTRSTSDQLMEHHPTSPAAAPQDHGRPGRRNRRSCAACRRCGSAPDPSRRGSSTTSPSGPSSHRRRRPSG